jgi:hypothetical protein
VFGILVLALELDLDLALELDLDWALDLTLDWALDLTLDWTLDWALELDLDLTLELDLEPDTNFQRLTLFTVEATIHILPSNPRFFVPTPYNVALDSGLFLVIYICI